LRYNLASHGLAAADGNHSRKSVIYSRLFQDFIRQMPRLYLPVHDYYFPGKRAAPYIVVAFPVTDETAAVLMQYLTQRFAVFIH
jgi:hypothetical protein